MSKFLANQFLVRVINHLKQQSDPSIIKKYYMILD